MDGLVDGKPRGIRRRLRFALARFNQDRGLLLVFWLLVDLFAITWVSPTSYEAFFAWTLIVVILSAGIVTIQLGADDRTVEDPAYVVHLAYLSGRERRVLRSPIGPPSSAWWIAYKEAMKTLGDRLTPGDPLHAILASLSDSNYGRRNRPTSVDEVLTAVELGLLEETYPLPVDKRRGPFLAYARELDTRFSQSPFTFDVWRQFLVSKYEALPPRLRSVAKTPGQEARVARLKDYVRNRWPEILVGVLIGVSSSLVGLLR